jgi:hypothetical protein
MKIEVGKWYLMRNGKKAFIERKTSDIYCMKGLVKGRRDFEYAWTDTGAYLGPSANSYDLVKELEMPAKGASSED